MGGRLKLGAAGLAFLLYLWVAGARFAPRVRAAKAARRRATV